MRWLNHSHLFSPWQMRSSHQIGSFRYHLFSSFSFYHRVLLGCEGGWDWRHAAESLEEGWKWSSFGSLSFTLPKCAQHQLGDIFQLMSLVDAPNLAQNQVGGNFQLMSLVDAPNLAQNQVGGNFQLMSLVDAPNLAQNQVGGNFQLMSLVDAPNLAQNQVGNNL